MECSYFYALRDIKPNHIPIIIKAEIDIENLVIDSRDFLYKIFSNYLSLSKEKKENIVNNLSQIFGIEVVEYIKKINACDNLDNVFGLCDLLTNNQQIIKNFYSNKTILGGGYKTITKYSYFIKKNIPKENILDIYTIPKTYRLPKPDLKFNDLF